MHRMHLPMIAGGQSGPPPLWHGFDPPRLTAELATLMRDDPGQRRSSLTVHPVLTAVAQARADDMSRRRYFGHTDPDGRGPNWHVRQAGYALPDWYPREAAANSVESIGGGFSTAGDFWRGLLASPGHRMHVLGLHPMYAMQVRVGVGWSYMATGLYRPNWVLLTCP